MTKQDLNHNSQVNTTIGKALLTVLGICNRDSILFTELNTN
jgi:hypothetical protein